MEKKEIYSALIGGTFFAVPYLTQTAALLPSLVIGTVAFGAGTLLFSTREDNLKVQNRSLWLTLEEAKNNNKKIVEHIPLIEDKEVKITLNNISSKVTKIINTISKKPNKIDNLNNFFEYYLPVTVKILSRYDELENQRLSSTESKKFFESTKKMLIEIDEAFNKMLNSLYQSEIIDTSAEMKVLNSMLKADGFDENEIKREMEVKSE